MVIISRKTVKSTSGFSILIRLHYALIDSLMRENSKVTVPHTSPTFPRPRLPRRWEGAEGHKLFTVCTK